jgi:hypothetical protein
MDWCKPIHLRVGQADTALRHLPESLLDALLQLRAILLGGGQLLTIAARSRKLCLPSGPLAASNRGARQNE